MNDLTVFDNPEFGAIRTIEIDGEPWFVGNDIAKALGYANPRSALIKHIDEEDVAIRDTLDNRGVMQPTKIINESGMYALIIISELPSAKKFKRWITKEVIPSIVKTGSYNLPQLTPNQMMLQLAQNAVEMEKRLEAHDQRFEAIEQIALESSVQVETALKVLAKPGGNWKDSMEVAIREMAGEGKFDLIKLKGDLYMELETVASCDLGNRQSRLKNRLKKQGATYRERQAVTKLDVISKDKQLRAIFEGIVRKYQAVYVAQAKGG